MDTTEADKDTAAAGKVHVAAGNILAAVDKENRAPALVNQVPPACCLVQVVLVPDHCKSLLDNNSRLAS